MIGFAVLRINVTLVELFKNEDEAGSLWKFIKLYLLEKNEKSNFFLLFQAKMSRYFEILKFFYQIILFTFPLIHPNFYPNSSKYQNDSKHVGLLHCSGNLGHFPPMEPPGNCVLHFKPYP